MHFTLQRDAHGRLVLHTQDGEQYSGITPVRAFPIAAPEEGLALISQDGREIAWVDQLTDLPVDARRLIEEDLSSREFVPEIEQLLSVSSFACPSTWSARSWSRAAATVAEAAMTARADTVSLTDFIGSLRKVSMSGTICLRIA